MVASQCTYGQNLDSSKNASFFMDNHVLRYQIAAHPRSKASELAEVLWDVTLIIQSFTYGPK
jgi:hypothetical protein